jgi:signal transduction histidine kinase
MAIAWWSHHLRARRRRLERLLESGLALGSLSNRDALPSVLADHVERVIGSSGVRVNLHDHPTLERGDLGPKPLRLPVAVGRASFGSIEVAPRHERPFGRADRAALATLALQAAVASQNERLLAAEREHAELRLELGAARRLLGERGRELAVVLDHQERERRHIADELHEGAAQTLAAVLFGLDALERDLETQAGSTQLGTLRGHVDRTLTALRQLAVTLRPPVLDGVGLAPALERMADDGRVGRMVVDLDGADGAPLGPSLETAVYRVVEEAVKALDRPREARVGVQDGQIVVEVAGGGGGPAGDLSTLSARLDLLGGSLVTDGTRELVARLPRTG